VSLVGAYVSLRHTAPLETKHHASTGSPVPGDLRSIHVVIMHNVELFGRLQAVFDLPKGKPRLDALNSLRRVHPFFEPDKPYGRVEPSIANEFEELILLHPCQRSHHNHTLPAI